jgi:hypothetical protein
MLLLLYNLLILGTLTEINPSIVLAQTMTSNRFSNNNIDYRGLSAESIEIAELIETDLLANATFDNGADSGGLSARALNIT